MQLNFSAKAGVHFSEKSSAKKDRHGSGGPSMRGIGQLLGCKAGQQTPMDSGFRTI
jgi:hypothetical protein